MKEESEKVGLKLNIQKTKIMASDPITSWEIDGETVSNFIFLGSKITADGNFSPLDCKEIQPVHLKGSQSWVFFRKSQDWSWNSNTLATSCEELTHWKRSWCLEGLRAGGEGDDRGWDGWMASPPRWTWVWVNSGSWWWTGRTGVLWLRGHKELDMTERLNWTLLKHY